MPYVDFETRSTLDLDEVGLYRYCDRRYTRPTCLAWDARDMPGEHRFGVWWPGDPFPQALGLAIKNGSPFWAHNSEFDEHVWDDVCGWPRVTWKDSMALAAYNGFPLGLDQIGKALGLEGKDKEGRAAMLKMAKAPFPDTPELRAKAGRYAFKDVAIMRKLVEQCEPLPPFLERVYQAHRDVNARGIAVDMPSVAKIISMVSSYIEANTRPVEAELGFKLSQVAVLQRWLNDRGAGLETLQADGLERWLVDNPNHPLGRVVRARLLAGLSSVKKYASMTAKTSDDGRLRGQYQFLTCRSGRMSSKGVQLHNLLRAFVDDIFFDLIPDMDAVNALLGDAFEQASMALRQTFVAEPGSEIVTGDYAQVELRILLWLVGEYAQLDRLAAGNDLYIELAWEIFEDWTLTKAANDFERQVGKKGKLGCGYGVGGETFQEMCRKEGLTIPIELANKTVAIYRKNTARVPAFWDAVEESYEAAFENPGVDVELTMVPEGPKVIFLFTGQHLKVTLPSRHRLIYRDAKLDIRDGLSYMGAHPKTHQWTRLRIWGSAMTGHIVQGIAAGLLHSAMVRLNTHYHLLSRYCRGLVLHTHDECGVEARKGFIDLKGFASIMAEQLDWTAPKAKVLPLKVDVAVGPRYKKG